jgi:hypothetical protein
MTGTRASGCPRPAVAGDGAAPLPTSGSRRPDPGNPIPSPYPAISPPTAPRSFVLAALRALHHDPVGGLIHACHQEGKGQTTGSPHRTLVEGLDRPRSFRDDRPRSFRDDIQRKRSHRSGMPSWSPPVRPPRRACRRLSAPGGATRRSQPPGLARDSPETSLHATSSRPTTPPSAGSLTCTDMWGM